MTELSKELIEKYVVGKNSHKAKKDALTYMYRTTFHFDGYDIECDKPNPYFKTLIDNNRPGENAEIKAYRRSVYKSVTKMPCDKVINSLRKITKASDYRIDYKASYQDSKIKEEETLQEYCEEYLPIYKSVTNWFLQVGLKENLTDPNGAIVVLPYSYDVKTTEYVKPLPYFISSENICEFKEGEYILYKSNKVYNFTVSGRTYEDNVYVFVNNKEVIEIYKLDFSGKVRIEPVYQFSFGELPAFRPGGVHWKIVDNVPVFKSLVDGMLPYLDIAAREWSDLEAEVVQHMYSTLWYYAAQDCTDCKGSGKIIRAGKPSVCGRCDGSGKMKLSPYHSIKINPAQFGENPIPTPPAGYIQKPTEIVTIQDTRIKGHITNALSAIHMEFLGDVQLNQSGVAKAYDRDELNNFVYGCAYHFVNNIIKPIYYFINELRYQYVVVDKKKRKEMLPFIGVPTKYELITANMMGDAVKQAREAEMDSTIINELEWEYARKAFNNDKTILGKMKCEKAHDPFGTMTLTEKSDLLLSNSIPKQDYVLSVYIGSFIERGIQEYKDFLDLPYEKQSVILNQYAVEKMNEALPSKQVLKEVTEEEKTLQKINSVSPLVANSILDSLDKNEIRGLVGLPETEDNGDNNNGQNGNSQMTIVE